MVLYSDFLAFRKGLVKCKNNLFWLEAGYGFRNIVLISGRDAMLLISIDVLEMNRGLVCTEQSTYANARII